MIFNSFEYLLFLPAAFILYWLICSRNVKLQNAFLLAVSYFFYALWDWRFLGLLFFTTLITYLSGALISQNSSHKRLVLVITIVLNISILFFFKYFNFFIQSFVDLFKIFGSNLSLSTLKIILPVGISFFTFTSLSYSIDVYKGKTAPTSDWLAYFSYVSFFPALFCGPISRSTKQLPQFQEKRFFSYDTVVSGFKLILWGFFMKLCVADRLCIYVDAVYNNIPHHNGISLLLSTVLYAFQLYCDFGGYSLIAIGSGKLFGITLQENFHRPYLSTSFTEYWKRNHISLTQWLMDYIYYPMIGGSDKLGWWNLCMIITFLISGLWHGAAWNFVLWGLYNGVWLVIAANTSRKRKLFERKYNLNNSVPYKFATITATFVIICFGLIFFRSASVSDAFTIIGKIFTNPGGLFIDSTTLFYGLLCFSLLFINDFMVEFHPNKLLLFNNGNIVVRWASYIVVIVSVILFGVFDGGSFIYFQF